MAICFYCKIEETQFHENDAPICLKCSDARATPRKPPLSSSQDIRAFLLQEVLRATALCDEAAMEFDKVVSQVPNSIPHPDGGKRIINATRKLAIARNEMVMAHNRLNDCLEQSDVLEDLKRTG